MKKIRLQADSLQVETFQPVDGVELRFRGTVRAAELPETTVRSCQTEQLNCTAQGGYTCDYGTCVSLPICP